MGRQPLYESWALPMVSRGVMKSHAAAVGKLIQQMHGIRLKRFRLAMWVAISGRRLHTYEQYL